MNKNIKQSYLKKIYEFKNIINFIMKIVRH